jgi:hypothetical protein
LAKHKSAEVYPENILVDKEISPKINDPLATPLPPNIGTASDIPGETSILTNHTQNTTTQCCKQNEKRITVLKSFRHEN